MKKKYLLVAILAVGATVQGQENQNIKLNETVITSENSEATISEIPKNISVLTGEEIQQRGAKTVAEALKLVSSVTVKEMGGADAKFDIRGQGATGVSNVLVLVDGAPINSIDLSGYKTSQIPVETIERIEVIPSGGSVLYGDGAIGGTINIVTKAPENKTNYGSFGAELGSYGLDKKELSYGTKVGENLTVEMDYQNRKKDGYRDNQKDNLEAFGLRTRYKLTDGELNLKYNYSNTEFKAPGSLTASEVEDDREQSSSNAWRIYDGKTERNNFVGDYTYRINSDLEFKLLGTYTHERYTSKSKDSWGNYELNYKTDITYIKPQLKYSYSNDSYVVFGGDLYKGETKQDTGAKYKKESLGGYIINSYTHNDFKFTQGYRRQNVKYKADGKNFSNKKFNEDALELTGSYLYSDSGSTYVSYSKAFRTPNTDEINVWDGDLKAQKTETYETGVKDYIGNTYIAGSIFYIETKNEIYYDPTANVPGSSWAGGNTAYDGTTKRKGVELSLEHYFDKLTISESVTYIDTEFKPGKEIPGVPKIKGVLNFNYRFTEKLTLNNSWEYYGKMYANNDDENIGEKVDDYILTGITLTYDFGNGLVINGGINNLFNEKYYDYVGGIKTSNTDNRNYYPAPERNFYAGFKYNF